MKTQPNKIDFSSLKSALKSLESALTPAPRNDRERDGAIQRFEYTFELCWKFIRRYLFAMGRTEVSGSPRPLLRDALSESLIDDLEIWFTFLEARNNTAHIYNKDEAEKIFKIVKKFPPQASALLTKMQSKLKQ
jgi:nucleotidyltransferase substrate binding protein (TIGR01987 family)